MFNPDGTEDFCGNGLRCAGLHGHLESWVGTSFEILHGGRWVPCEIRAGQVSVTLPPASFEPESVPTSLPAGQSTVAGLTGFAVSTGSPHFVAFVPELPDDETFFRVSRAIETAPEFPESISVMWTKVVSPHRLALRIWERGVGETLGCGTGSVAAAAVWARQARSSGKIQVDNPGGPVAVEMRDGEIVSTTSPTSVFVGEVTLSSQSLLSTAAWPPTSLH
jgi:diaminopimelate epimerase